MPAMISGEQLAELKQRVYRGRRARLFVQTETYRDIDQELGERQAKVEEGLIWSPNVSRRPDEVAMLTAYGSGRSYEIGQIQSLFARWMRDGNEAEAKLKELKIEI